MIFNILGIGNRCRTGATLAPFSDYFRAKARDFMAKVAKRRGRYVLDFYDPQGVRIRKSLKPGATLKQARDALREIEDQINRGVYLPDDRIPVFSKVAEDWLESKKTNIRETTWAVYECHVRRHLSAFNQLKINRITTADIEKLINGFQVQAVNILTIRKTLTVLGQILKYAVRHRYLAYNPFLDAERPRRRQDSDIEETKIRILNPDEIGRLLDAIEKPKYKMFVQLAIMSGARQGELFGLKWSDIDWQSNQIHVQRTFNNFRWYKPKSKASDRKIDLGPSTMTALKRWRMACLPNELNLVFSTSSGLPISRANFMKQVFDPALEETGIGHIRFHDLRHTFASLLIEQGENIKYIQTQLGHSSPKMTLEIYAHLMKPANPESAKRLETTILQNTGHNMVTNERTGISQKV